MLNHICSFSYHKHQDNKKMVLKQSLMLLVGNPFLILFRIMLSLIEGSNGNIISLRCIKINFNV